uniref:C-type lectin domain-containing protein n=1 Tax=Panagrolaimus sp. ES5 TaxID=591445 RepID=A0AC34FYH0_9BILA
MTSANIWEWSDNSKFDFIDWAKGEPSKNSSDLKCISLSMLDGYWRAQNCLNSKPYVCVIPKQYFTKTTPSSPISNCSKGWIYFEPTNSCYAIFSPNQLPDHDWQWAENYCLTFGAHTPSIHSEDEQAFLHGYVHEYDDSAWLGLYSIDNGTTWQYTDNTPVDYLQWGIREPNIIYGERNCVISTTDRKSQLGWFEVTSCNSILMTACKKPRN